MDATNIPAGYTLPPPFKPGVSQLVGRRVAQGQVAGQVQGLLDFHMAVPMEVVVDLFCGDFAAGNWRFIQGAGQAALVRDLVVAVPFTQVRMVGQDFTVSWVVTGPSTFPLTDIVAAVTGAASV